MYVLCAIEIKLCKNKNKNNNNNNNNNKERCCQLRHQQHWTCHWYSSYDDGLSFISVNLSERLSLKVYQVAPRPSLISPRYCPFRLDLSQIRYHQAPVEPTAHLSLESPSLSFVLNGLLLWYANESPAVPEYEPTSSRYCACSSLMLNLPYLAYTLAPFQSSSSTRRELGLEAVSRWILSFPNQNSAVSWPKPAL